jgi:CTP:phosphocholine cytidylyltransferase-like protein
MNVPSISDLTTNLVPAVKAIIKFIGFVFVCVFMTSYFEYLKNFYSIKDIYKNTYTDENGVKVCN